MKKLITKVLFCTVICSFAKAESFYPDFPTTRPQGHHQGLTGSCQSEATVFALENAFQQRGLFVKFSHIYNHAFNWQEKPSLDSINQSYTPNDRRVFEHFNGILPDYMLPEDGRGFFYSTVQKRPSISTWGNIDMSFPSASSFKYSKKFLSFQSGWSNSANYSIDDIKNHIRNKKPIVISVHSFVLQDMDFDRVTGLHRSKYNIEDHKDVFLNDKNVQASGTNHAVAVVGFDDNLYADQNYSFGPGAFIIRNSWNENGYSKMPRVSELVGKKLQAFREFKKNINPEAIEEGYYAVPYQYINDLLKYRNPSHSERSGAGGIEIFDIDYNRYSSYYNQYARKYTVMRVPFTCTADRFELFSKTGFDKILKAIRSENESEYRKALRALNKFVARESITSSSNLLKIALVSTRNDGNLNELVDFYNGKFQNYYCNQNLGAKLGPSPAVLNHPEFLDVLTRLRLDPYSFTSSFYLMRMFNDFYGENYE